MPPWFLILLGLVTLVVGAELLVRGSSWIAEALGVRPLIVGLTVVAIGTSAPELVVSLVAVSEPDTIDIVLGNIFGSNIANIALILGATALVMPIVAKDAKLRFEVVWLLVAGVLTFLPFLMGQYDRGYGVFLVGLITLFIIWLVQRERRARPERPKNPGIERSGNRVVLHIAMVPVGLAGLVFGGGWLVDGAVEIATELGWSKGVIAATIIAIGTSLPELATSIVAARKGHPELALGNIIGSNIFNILMVLGVTSLFVPIPADFGENGMRTSVAMGLTFVLAVLLLGPKHISRTAGCILLAAYVVYIFVEVRLA